MEEELKQYIKELENQIKYLEQQLIVVEQDRDETKFTFQSVMAKYLELFTEKNGVNNEELFKELGENMKKIIEER